MRRRLILMRHGHAPTIVGGIDHERSLSLEGQAEASSVAIQLRRQGWEPDLVQVSSARRTCETWAAMARELTPGAPPQFHRVLYLAGLETIREEAPGWPAAASTLLLLGHNPGWEAAVAELSGDTPVLRTAAAALLEGEGFSWAWALRGRWRLVGLLLPERAR